MKKLFLFSLVLFAAVSMSLSVVSSPAFATENQLLDDANKALEEQRAACKESGASDCEKLEKDPFIDVDCRNENMDCNPVTKYINPLINSLAVLVGIAVTIGIIVGGIQYASSGGDPQKAAAGKQHIKMAVIALVGFFFMYAFLAFLLPEGMLTR